MSSPDQKDTKRIPEKRKKLQKYVGCFIVSWLPSNIPGLGQSLGVSQVGAVVLHLRTPRQRSKGHGRVAVVQLLGEPGGQDSPWVHPMFGSSIFDPDPNIL